MWNEWQDGHKSIEKKKKKLAMLYLLAQVVPVSLLPCQCAKAELRMPSYIVDQCLKGAKVGCEQKSQGPNLRKSPPGSDFVRP